MRHRPKRGTKPASRTAARRSRTRRASVRMALISLICVTPMATSSSGLLGKLPDFLAEPKLRRAVLSGRFFRSGGRRRPPVSLERIRPLRTDTPPSNPSVLVSLIEQSVAVMLAARTDEARRHQQAPDHRTRWRVPQLVSGPILVDLPHPTAGLRVGDVDHIVLVDIDRTRPPELLPFGEKLAILVEDLDAA